MGGTLQFPGRGCRESQAAEDERRQLPCRSWPSRLLGKSTSQGCKVRERFGLLPTNDCSSRILQQPTRWSPCFSCKRICWARRFLTWYWPWKLPRRHGIYTRLSRRQCKLALGEEVPWKVLSEVLERITEAGLGVALAEVVHKDLEQGVLWKVLSEVLKEGMQVVADAESKKLLI